MSRHRRGVAGATVRVAAALVAAVAALGAAPQAWSAPEAIRPQATAPTASPTATPTATVPFAVAGQSATITFGSPPASSGLTLPVPAGQRAAAVTGLLDVAADGSAGYLEVSSSGRRLSVIDLTRHRGTTFPVRIPLTGATVTRNAVALQLSLLPPDNTCRTTTGLSPTRLRNLALVLTGSESDPRTVAQFLPPILRNLEIRVPGNPSASVRQAAVTLAGAIAARYSPATPTIRVAPDRSAVQSAMPWPARTIRLAGTGSARLALVSGSHGRMLQIDGTGDALAAQVAAIGNDLGSIALASAATATRGDTAPQVPASTATFEALGLGTQQASGPGSVTLAPGVNADTLGAPSAGWTVHLLGTVTGGGVVGSDGDRGQLSVSVAGLSAGSWAVPADGHIDRTVTVPAASLQRFTSLTVTATANGALGGTCGNQPLVMLQLDPATTVTAIPATRPYTGGFADMPAALRPSYQIASIGSDLTDLADVVGIAVALQRLTPNELDPQLVDAATLVRSTQPGVLIATGALPAGLSLPVATGTGHSVTVTVPRLGSVTIPAQVAAAQVVSTKDRYLVVVSGSDSQLVHGLSGWLAGTTGLSTLTGDLALWTGGPAPTQLSMRTAPQSGAARSATRSHVAAVVGGAIVLALIVAALAILAATRRRRPAPAAPRRRAEDFGPPGEGRS